MKKPFVVLASALLVSAVSPVGCDFRLSRPAQPVAEEPATPVAEPAKSEKTKGKESPDPAQKRAPGLLIGRSSVLGNYRNYSDHELEVREFSGWTVCLVADGIGGEQAGKAGSKRAIEVLSRELKANLPATSEADAVKKVIRQAMVTANNELIALGKSDKKFMHAGATAVVAAFKPGENMYVAGLGDCRAYLVHQQEIKQLTVDHSVAQALVEQKTITAQEARTHRFRNVLWKYLGTKESREGPEVQAVPVEAGDRLLLCTPGLTSVVSDEKLLRNARDNDNVQKCADGLTALAMYHNSRDNASCMVLTVTAK